MKWTIENSGTIIRELDNNQIGIQIRYCIWFESKDKDYKKRLIEEEIIDELDNTKTIKTGKLILVPLHNHFIVLPIDVTDILIETIGDQLVKIVTDYNDLGYFDNGEVVSIPNSISNYDLISDANKEKGYERINLIKTKLKWQL